jgi:hypothetical protein
VRRWQAERLDQPAAGATGLARWLGDYAADGGVGRTRDLIGSHVQTHGLAQLLRDVRKVVEDLKAARQELHAKLPEPAAARDARTSEDKLEAVEKRLGHLAAYYQERLTQLERDPTLRVPRDGQLVPLSEVLREEIAFQVCEWGQWDALFQHSSGGYISEPAGEDYSGPVFKDDDDEGGPARTFPTTSDDLYEPFEHAVGQLQKACRAVLLEGLGAYLETLQRELADDRAEIAPLLENPDAPRQVRSLRLGARGQGLVPALKAAVDPARIRAVVFPGGDAERFQIPLVLQASALFPLARSRGGVPGRVFAWARRLQEAPDDLRPERHHAHQCQVLRIRGNFIDTLAQELNHYLGVGLRQALDRLQQGLREIREKLSLVAGNRFILDALLAPPPATEQPAADALAPLRRIAAEPW